MGVTIEGLADAAARARPGRARPARSWRKALGFDPLTVARRRDGAARGRARAASRRADLERAKTRRRDARAPRPARSRRPAHDARASPSACAAASIRRSTRASATCCATSGRSTRSRSPPSETCAAGWWLVRRAPLPGDAEPRLSRAGRRPGRRSAPRATAARARRSAVEIAYDTLAVAARARRAAARRRLGLVAQPEQRPGLRRPRRVRRARPRRDRLLARGPLRHARRLPAALTSVASASGVATRPLVGHQTVYFVTMKRAGYCLFSVSPSERSAIGLLDDQQRVHVLERDGSDYVVRHEWPVAERLAHRRHAPRSARWPSRRRSPSSSGWRRDADRARARSRDSGARGRRPGRRRLRDEARSPTSARTS